MAENTTLAVQRVVTPMTLIEKALEGDFDIDKMTKLYELQQRYEKDQAEKSFHSAVAAFRAECPVIEATKKGHNCKFAGLAESIEQIKPYTSKQGLSHYWDMEDRDDGKIKVNCFISHELGHKIKVTSPWCDPDDSGKKNPIQAVKSTVSYLERITFFAGFGLASKDMDDDGGLPKDQPDVISEAQWADLDTLLDQAKADREKFCKAYQIKDIAFLPAAQFAHAIKSLNNKIEKERTK